MGILLPDVHSLSWIEIRTPERTDRVPAVATLGVGEKEVLALGLQVRDAVVILDERLGRFYAESLKLAGHRHAWNPTPSEAGRPDHPRRTGARSFEATGFPFVGADTRERPPIGWRA